MQAESDASRRGKKGLSSRDMNAKARGVVGRGRGDKSLLCDPGSELPLILLIGRREKRTAKTMNLTGKTRKKKESVGNIEPITGDHS